MDDRQLAVLFKYLEKYLSNDEIEEITNTCPLTGPNGIRRIIAQMDIEAFALLYLPEHFDREFCAFHRDLIENVQSLVSSYSCESKEDQEKFRSQKIGKKLLTIAPRGHGKSRVVNVLVNLYNLLYKKSPFIVCISANDALASSFLELVKVAIETNPAIIEDFGNLKGKIWNNTQIELSNGTCLIAKGIRSKLRGLSWGQWRATSIILDDIEDDRQASSEISTEEIKHIFRSTVMEMGDTYTDFIFLGTIISEDTLINELYKSGTGWKKLFYKAVYDFSNSPLWDEWRKIYTNLSNINAIEDAKAFFVSQKTEMLRGTSVLWPEKNDYYFLMCKRIDNGDRSFWAELQNSPRSSADYAFQKLSYWKMLPDFTEMDIVLFADPSMGKVNGDFSGITVMGKHKKTGYKYVIDGQLHKVKPNELIKIIVELCKKYPITQIGFESVSFQEYVSTDLKNSLKQAELYQVIVRDVKPRTSKHNRIMNLEPFTSRGEILFNRDCVQYNEQIKDYSAKAKFDDAIDSLQGAFELVESNTYKQRVFNKPKGW